MAITGTVGSSGNTTVTTVYVPAQVLGINDLPDYDNTTKNDLGPIIWDNTASKYKTSGQMSISSSEIDLTATTIDINGAADISGNLGVGGDLTVTGSSTFNGGTLTFGDSDSDNVVFGADINSDLIPNTDNTYHLGSSSKEWKNLYIDGTAHIDTLDIDNNATINGTLTCKGNVDLQDNDRIKVGSGDDMHIYHDGSNSYITNDVGALKIATEDSGIVVTIGHTTSEVTVADNLTVTGNFTVSGTTTTVDSTTINIQNAFVFEGATDDAYETTLTTVDPTADRTLSLPNATDTLVGKATTDTLTNKTLTTPVIAEIDSGSTITLDATTDIILDADGGDIFFKDGGTTFGSATNTSGNLIIKSGTTTALTFSGANATLAGDLTISGDDLIMGTNTSAYMLVADGTSYNPVAVSGDVSIASGGAVTIAGTSVETGMIAADAVTGAKIADDAIDSEHYAAGSIDSAHLADDAVTLAKLAGGTDGNIISFDASGNPVAVSTGSDGQVLTSSGSGAVCAFEDAAAGGAGYFLGNSSGASGDTSTGLEDIFRVNSATVDNSCTIATATNASATGPLTVSSGVTVTVAGVLAVI